MKSQKSNNQSKANSKSSASSGATSEKTTQPDQNNAKRVLMIVLVTIGIIATASILLISLVIAPLLIKASIAPTPERAEETCTKMNGEYKMGDIKTAPQTFIDIGIKGAYTCAVTDDEGSTTGFQLMTFEGGSLNTDAAKEAVYSFIAADEKYVSEVKEYITTVEDTEKIYKSYFDIDSEGKIYYFAAYKDGFTMILSDDLESVDQLLIDLGYPEETKDKS